MNRLISRVIGLLAVTGAYLYAFPNSSLVYIAIVFVHVGLGIAATGLLLVWAVRYLARASRLVQVSALVLLLAAFTGLLLTVIGATRPHASWMVAHIGTAVAGTALLVFVWMRTQARWTGLRRPAVASLILLLGLIVIGLGSRYSRYALWSQRNPIENPPLPPDTMDGEGDGPKGAFFPSSAQTTDGRKIPAAFFMKSEACERCHSDIYKQWNSSAHRFSSFNNQWYRKSIEYMQEVVGTRPSKWCGGCHDPAVLFSGLMDTPITQLIDRPEAHAGLACMMCHSIVQVKSSMGQGDFVVEYPKLHELAASDNPVSRWLHDFAIRLNPEPHRRSFLKPFMRQQTAEFCSSCHKVHLDVPVNAYRWMRGFNDYDNWQASGVSGQGARSFYYPPKPQKCVDCHMPLIESNDDGNINGKVHSHRFPAANTALPVANQDPEQFEVIKQFLQDGIIRVDIFALSEAQPRETGGHFRQEMSTSFAVGEEAELAVPEMAEGVAAPVSAPIDRVRPAIRAGDNVRVDVVVRTLKVGHFFPGGTVDAFDVWLELQALDGKGNVIFWSGRVEDGGKGPVEKSAHFYRSLMIDGKGTPINKRNAWATRALVYVRLIPPGAADTVRYRLSVPKDVAGPIRLKAKLNYRKFSWWNTHFSYAGAADPAAGGEFSPSHDTRQFLFSGDTSKVSGRLKEVPDLPIITLAQDEQELAVVPRTAAVPEPAAKLEADDWQRWNDYGIGLLLQGDLRAAEAAFVRVTEIDPTNPDGWVNIGRVRVQEGDTRGARTVLEKALQLKPNLARAMFFYGRALRSDGEYDRAAELQRKVLAQYPRDRVVRNELGRILFLQRKYRDAISEFQQVLAVDPEDLQAHYNLMLCFNGLGDQKRAEQHQRRYIRFKADESAQALTGAYRQKNPEDNNERQFIHEHASAPPERKASSPAKVALRGARKPERGSTD